MKLMTRLGLIDIEDDEILHFPAGILGFPQCRRYIILDHHPDSPVKWLQAVEKEDLAFPIAAPADFAPDYTVTVSAEDLSSLGVESGADLRAFVILTIPKGAPERTTANLRAPVVVNPDTRMAMQILTEEDHPIRYPLVAASPLECVK